VLECEEEVRNNTTSTVACAQTVGTIYTFGCSFNINKGCYARHILA
jgi:hypothetical protein